MRVVIARKRPNAAWTKELVLVEHDSEYATQFAFVQNREQTPIADTGSCRVMKSSTQLGTRVDEPLEALCDFRVLREKLRLKWRGRTERQQTYHRPDLNPLHLTAGQPQYVIEKAILLVPHPAAAHLHQ